VPLRPRGAGGGDTRIFVGATLELLLIIANIGTAVVPFALFERYDERLALGYVTARVMECMFIAVGIVSVLAIMTLRDDPGGTSDSTLVAIGQSLVGSPLVCLSGIGVIFGAFDAGSAPQGIATIPEISGRRSSASI
jgi:Domain of unknown function (DUF4386)